MEIFTKICSRTIDLFCFGLVWFYDTPNILGCLGQIHYIHINVSTSNTSD